MKLIAIEGNIGVGKSTLLNTLGKREDSIVFKQPVHEWNPLLIKFYKNPAKYSFQLQNLILGSYQKIQKEIELKLKNKNKYKYIFIECCGFTSFNVFTKNLLENSLITQENYDSIYLEFKVCISHLPDIFVYLDCPSEICLKRINERKRVGEEDINILLLKQIHERYEDVWKELNQHNTSLKCIKIQSGNSRDQVIRSFYESMKIEC